MGKYVGHFVGGCGLETDLQCARASRLEACLPHLLCVRVYAFVIFDRSNEYLEEPCVATSVAPLFTSTRLDAFLANDPHGHLGGSLGGVLRSWGCGQLWGYLVGPLCVHHLGDHPWASLPNLLW